MNVAFEKFIPLLMTLCLCTFIFLLGSPFLTYDSYHYMNLSIHPTIMDSHSMGFGFLLKLFSKIWDKNPEFFIPTLKLWNLIPIIIITYFLIDLTIKWIKIKRFCFITLLLTLIFYIFCIVPIFLGLTYLANSVWTEMTNFLQLIISSALLYKLFFSDRKLQKTIYAFVTILFFIWSYHTRYLMIILPVCFFIIGFTFFFNHKHFNFKTQNTITLMLVGILGISSIFFSEKILSFYIPQSPNKSGTTFSAVTNSIQCTLRCDVKMYEQDCSSIDGRLLIQKSRCTDFVFALKAFGKTVDSPENGLMAIFKRIGLKKTIKWVIMAPFTYLRDYHDIELGVFDFYGDKNALKSYSDLAPVYSKFFQNSDTKVSHLFINISRLCDKLFKQFKYYHTLVIFYLLLCFYLSWTSYNIFTIFFSYFFLITFLLFSYLNPHVPFRYLIHLLVPAMLAVLFEIKKLIRS